MPRQKPHQTTLNHTLAGVSSLPDLSTNSSEDSAQALLQLALALLDSALDILNSHITSDKQLQHESTLMPGGTPGKHFRHVIETFRAFVLPLHPQADALPPGPVEINYDAILPSTRRRVAKSLGACRKELASVREDLHTWGERCRTHADAKGLAEELSRNVVLVAITPTRQEMASSLGRELWFCSLHAIHHFSMLRTIAVHELGLSLPVEFGTAPSTLLYRKNTWSAPKKTQEVRVVKSKL